MRAALFALVLLAGCRTRAVTTHYAGPHVGACQAGRAYQAPPIGSPTQPFVPLVASAPAATTTKSSTDDSAEPVADETADKSDNIEKPAAKVKKKPAKKSKKKEAP